MDTNGNHIQRQFCSYEIIETEIVKSNTFRIFSDKNKSIDPRKLSHKELLKYVLSGYDFKDENQSLFYNKEIFYLNFDDLGVKECDPTFIEYYASNDKIESNIHKCLVHHIEEGVFVDVSGQKSNHQTIQSIINANVHLIKEVILKHKIKRVSHMVLGLSNRLSKTVGRITIYYSHI